MGYTLAHDTLSPQPAPGAVEELQLGGVMAHIVVRVGDNLIESVITRRSAEAMALKKGDAVKVVITESRIIQ